jgi:hypothetical protein
MATEKEYKDAVNAPGAWQVFRVDTTDEPAAAWKGKVTLTRSWTFRGRTGVDYAKLAVNAERDIQPRKWGTRRDRWFVDHTPKSGPRKGIASVYATCFVVEDSIRSAGYWVNGEPVSREEYNSYRTASASKPKAFPNGGYMDIELSTITPVAAAAEGTAAEPVAA